MKRQLWINLGLALGVVVLAWLVFFKSEQLADAGLHKLSNVKAAQVENISIHVANQPPIALVKKQNTWFLTEPLNARADPLRVESLLGVLTAQSEKRFAAKDLVRYELDKPLAQLQLGTQSFAFGGVQPLSNQLYVLTNDAVYLISPVYFLDVTKPATALIAKQILAPEEVPVAFEFPHYTLTREEGTWRKKPSADTFTQDSANAFADEWVQAQATSVQPATSLASAKLVRISLQSGKTLRVLFARADNVLLLLREDEGLLYRFPTAAGNSLLQPAFAPPHSASP